MSRRPYLRTWLAIPVLILALAACTLLPGSGESVHITILYTNDEHGWMAGNDDIGGAAAMLQRWREDEAYTPDGPFLVLSGGDIWTGPALSSWFHGESMVEVMNAMGYDAVVLGNHEFDYGLEGLRERGAQAEFAFLAANVSAATRDQELPFLPYIIQDVVPAEGGPAVSVGIIGLASQRTPMITMPTYTAGLTFEDYNETLARTVPEVRAAGADVIVAITHLCEGELQTVLDTAADLGIAMLGGGHCHRHVNQVKQGVALVEAQWRMEAYARVDLTIDAGTGDVVNIETVIKPNDPGPEDADVARVVARWSDELDDALLVPIGYTEEGVDQHSNAMHNMVMDAWLAAYPADIAMNNPGSFRQDLDPGEITLADIVSILPFDNTLVDVAITGEQVMRSYQHGNRLPAVGGLERKGAQFLVDGEPTDPEKVYHVLINDYMYAGGDGYAFADYDPDAYMTGIDWRLPVIEWISGLDTSPEHPLDAYLDDSAR